MSHTCRYCQREFAQRCSLTKHQSKTSCSSCRKICCTQPKLKAHELGCIIKSNLCTSCHCHFTSAANLELHRLSIKECEICSFKACQKSAILRHKRIVHGNQATPSLNICRWCRQLKHLEKDHCKGCATNGQLCLKCRRHMPNRYFGLSQDVCDTCHFKDQRGGTSVTRRQALGNNVTDYKIIPEQDADILLSFAEIKNLLADKLRDAVLEFKGIKYFIKFSATFQKSSQEGETVFIDSDFTSEIQSLTHPSEIGDSIPLTYDNLYTAYDAFIARGSGWSLDKVNHFLLSYATYNPLSGGTYIPLPDFLEKKKAIVNVENRTDSECLKWSILSAVFPPDNDNPNRLTNYTDLEHELDFSGINYPSSVADAIKFERQNALISLNVYGLEGKVIYPLHTTKIESNQHVDLLLLEEDGNNHFCWIKNFDRAMRKLKGRRKYHCKFCMHGYAKEETLRQHLPRCATFPHQKIKMPKHGEDIHFKNWKHLTFNDFIIYADTEAYLRPIQGCQNPDSKPYTRDLQEHAICSFAYKVVCRTNENFTKPTVVYTASSADDDVAKKFIDCLQREREYVMKKIYNEEVPLKLTPEQESSFQAATECWVCKEPFTESNPKHRDHRHICDVVTKVSTQVLLLYSFGRVHK